MTSKKPKPAKTIVVDEGISDDNVARFKSFAAERGLKLADCLYIRQLHAGKMYQDFFKQLSESFTQLEFVPVSKGRHMESLRSKLTQLLTCRDTNEIQQDNIRDILCRFAAHGEMLTPPVMLCAGELTA